MGSEGPPTRSAFAPEKCETDLLQEALKAVARPVTVGLKPCLHLLAQVGELKVSLHARTHAYPYLTSHFSLLTSHACR